MAAVVEAGFVGLSIDYRLVGDDPVSSAEFQPIADDFEAMATQLGLADGQRAQLNAAVAAFEDTVTALDWARDKPARLPACTSRMVWTSILSIGLTLAL